MGAHSRSKTPELFGAAALLLGTLVLCGWFGRISFLVQLFPGFAPMQFNTAVGIVLAGFGVVFVESRPRVASAIGALVTVLATAVVVEFAADADLGIDQVLFPTWLPNDTQTPGRMSITTAIWFVIAGLSLVASVRRSSRWIRWRMMGGMSLICMSIVALFGPRD